MDPRIGLDWLHEGLDGNVGQFSFRSSAPQLPRQPYGGWAKIPVTAYDAQSARANAFQSPARAAVVVPQFVNVRVLIDRQVMAQGSVSMPNLTRALNFMAGRFMVVDENQPTRQGFALWPSVDGYLMLYVVPTQLNEVLRLLGLRLIAPGSS